ncbi:MAG: M48 family metallopeptidase [Desulfitobacteriaceae bacterium]
MLSWFLTMPLWLSVLISLFLIGMNLLFSLFVAWHVKTKYEKTGSAELAMNRLRVLSTYIQSLVLFATMILVTLQMMPHLKHLGFWLKIMGIFLPVLLGSFILIGNQLILFRTRQMIRGTSDTRKEQVGTLLRFLLFMYAPMMVFFALKMLISDGFKLNIASGKLWSMLFPMLFYSIIYLVVPFFHRYMLKAVIMAPSPVQEQLSAFLKRAGLEHVKIYTWPTKKSRVANALVSGYLQKNVYISDYILHNCTTEEIEGILAHEIGHLKKHHLWIRYALILVTMPMFYLIGEFMDIYEKQIAHIPIWVGLLIMGVVIIVYFIFVLLYLIRTQEREADKYVLRLGVQPANFISALKKLAKLNHMVMKFNRVDEKFQTHPSFSRRIKWIMETAKMSDEEVQF